MGSGQLPDFTWLLKHIRISDKHLRPFLTAAAHAQFHKFYVSDQSDRALRTTARTPSCRLRPEGNSLS